MDEYFALELKSGLTGEWFEHERKVLKDFENPQIALDLIIDIYNAQVDYNRYEKRIVKISREIVYMT